MEAVTSNVLNAVEVRMIRSLLAKKSYADISALLDKPVEVVSGKIVELVAADSSLQVFQPRKKKYSEQQLQEKASRRAERENKKLLKQQEINRKKALIEAQARSRAIIKQQEEQRRREREKPKYTTRSIDYSQMQTVRIDNRTSILVKIGEDVEAAKQRYLKLMKK